MLDEQSNDEARQGLEDSLMEASNYILTLEDKCYQSNKVALELLRQVRDHQDKADKLKQYVLELRTRSAIYIPARNDHIDKRLAEIINNHPERWRLKFMFLRESSGLYSFGSRKITLSIDKRNRISVRVGGGYLSIDEFLDHCTPVELTKIERRSDHLQRFPEQAPTGKLV